MSGVKGRSGRRPFSEEAKRHFIIDMAWNLTKEKLESQDKEKYAIAKDMVLKDMISKEDVKLEADVTQEEKNIIDKYINPIHTNRLSSKQ